MDTGARKTEVDKEIANVLRTAATNSGAPGVSRIQAAGAVKVKQGVSKMASGHHQLADSASSAK